MIATDESIRDELVVQGVATAEQVARAAQLRDETGGTMVEHLVGLGIDARALVLPLCTAAGMLPASAPRVRAPDAAAAGGFPPALLARYAIVPFELGPNGVPRVAYADPLVAAAAEVRGLPPHTAVMASLSDVRAGLAALLNIDDAVTLTAQKAAATGVVPAPFDDFPTAPVEKPPTMSDAGAPPSGLVVGTPMSQTGGFSDVFTDADPRPEPPMSDMATEARPGISAGSDAPSALTPAAVVGRDMLGSSEAAGAPDDGDGDGAWAGQARWAEGTEAGLKAAPAEAPFNGLTASDVDPSRVATEPYVKPPPTPSRSPLAGLSSKELKDLKPGVELGDFKIARRLGVGGMAAVYLAERGGEQVALKLMMPHLADDPTFISRFQREIAACLALEHPNIVGILDHGEFEGLAHYLVSEFVDGGTVLGLRRTLGQVPAVLTAQVLADILAGLSYAHERGVIHRDIKPANLLMSSARGPAGVGRVKLADFGIAKQSTDNTLTATGMLVGTPAYMSPEQALGLEIDHRSDLYAVGIVAYELITGVNPYLHDNPAVVIMRVGESAAPPIFQAAPTIPGVLERVIGGLLSRDPAQRYPHAQAAIDDLQPLLEMGADLAPDLIGAAVVDPLALQKHCVAAMVSAEQARATTLLDQGPSGAPAASLALYRACLLDPHDQPARARFDELCRRHHLNYGSLEGDAHFVALTAEMEGQKVPAPGLLRRAAERARAARNPFVQAVYLKQYLEQRPSDSVALQQLQVLLGWSDAAATDATSTAASLLAPTGLPDLDTQQVMAGLKTGGFKASDRAGERPMTVQTVSSASSSDPATPAPRPGVIEGPSWVDMVRSWLRPALALLAVIVVVGGGLRLVQGFIQHSQDQTARELDLLGGVKSIPGIDPTPVATLTETATTDDRQRAAIKRGRTLAGEEKWLAAVAEFDKAIEMSALSLHGFEALLERGRTHLAAGIPLAAKADFELVVTRAGKNSPYGREATRELTRLEADD